MSVVAPEGANGASGIYLFREPSGVSSTSACFELRALRSLSDTDTSAHGYWARLLSRLAPTRKRGSQFANYVRDSLPNRPRPRSFLTPQRRHHTGESLVIIVVAQRGLKIDLGALIGSYLMTIIVLLRAALRLFAVGNSQSLVHRPWFGFT